VYGRGVGKCSAFSFVRLRFFEPGRVEQARGAVRGAAGDGARR